MHVDASHVRKGRSAALPLTCGQSDGQTDPMLRSCVHGYKENEAQKVKVHTKCPAVLDGVDGLGRDAPHQSLTWSHGADLVVPGEI